MSSTLSEGVRVPDIGSINWGADVNFNWGLLNTALANIRINVKTNVENTWTATQTFTETIDGVAARAVGDEDGNNIKNALAGKQPSLSQAQLDAVNSGITAAAVQQISTNADAIATKAADSEVVHLTGAETITGDKTFSGAVTFDGWLLATGYQQIKTSISTDVAPSSTQYFGYNYANNNDGTQLLHHRAFVSANTLNNTLRYWVRPNTSTGDNYGGFQVVAYGDGSTVATFKPRGNLEPFDPNYGANLGSSSLKWKTLNGVNPGALSLPNLNYSNSNQWIDISGNITQLTGGDNWYYPTVDGWVFVITKNNPVFLNVIVFATTGKLMTGASGVVEPSSGAMWVSCPAPAGSRVRIRANNGSSGAIESAQFILCQGNV